MKKFTDDVAENLIKMGYNVDVREDIRDGQKHECITIINDAMMHPSFRMKEFMDFTDNPKECAEYIEWLINHEIELPALSYDLNDYDSVKSHLKPVLLPQRYLKEDTANVTASPMGYDDLYLGIQILDVLKSNDENLTAITYATNNMINSWGVRFEEAFLDACNNYINKAFVRPLAEVIAEMTDTIPDMYPSPFYICALENQENMGAIASILAKEKLDELFPNGYLIVPSSIHEILVLPLSMDEDTINELITSVNSDVLNPKDVLSDHVYKFAQLILPHHGGYESLNAWKNILDKIEKL